LKKRLHIRTIIHHIENDFKILHDKLVSSFIIGYFY
jgi:hypothetical protein